MCKHCLKNDKHPTEENMKYSPIFHSYSEPPEYTGNYVASTEWEEINNLHTQLPYTLTFKSSLYFWDGKQFLNRYKGYPVPNQNKYWFGIIV